MKPNANYKVYYAEIPPHDIYNECGPNPLKSGSWQQELTKIKNRNRLDNFYNNLEVSIAKEGVRNPICASFGWYPPQKKYGIPKHLREEDFLCCHIIGGSRLYFAQKHNLESIPVIVSAFKPEIYQTTYPESKQIQTLEDIDKYFVNKPAKIRPTDIGIIVRMR